ncbi:MAG: hydrogenase [Planctomycetes bacterium]|nr:hydrogenase [Planctomycetota bacterium]
MNVWINSVLAFLVLMNLLLLGHSRLRASIRLVAAQGIVLGLLPLLSHAGAQAPRFVFLAAASMVLKGIVFPALLYRAVRETKVSREMEPFVGYSLSIGIGVLLLGVSLWLGSRLPLPSPVLSPLIVPVSLFTILVGLFLLVSRKKAITQVLGYLVLENGIYTFGVALALEPPLLVELGVLLDVFVAVFVMGITIFHIQREFDHIDIDRLKVLKD